MKREMKYSSSCFYQNQQESMLLDYIFKEYNTPMFTQKLSCCKYPDVSVLPYIWRDHLKSIMTFLGLARTGVQGYVQDDTTHTPMRNATIKVVGVDRLFDVTKISAHFKIMLPAGKYSILVSCHEYESKTMDIEVRDSSMLHMVILLKRASGKGTVENVTELPKVFTGVKGKFSDL